MNGRIYDPLLGRFLSADLVVQFPGSLQSYNRYSYVENNPLTRMDPTGWYSILGLEFTNGGGVGGFFSDLKDYAVGAGSAAGQGAVAYANGFNRGAVGAVVGTAKAIADPLGAAKATADGLGTLAGRAVYDTKALVAETKADLSDPTKIGEAFGGAVTSVALVDGAIRGATATSEVTSTAASTDRVATTGTAEARIENAAPKTELAPEVPEEAPLQEQPQQQQMQGAQPESRTNWGAEHGKGNVEHNNWIEDKLDNAKSRGATDMRKNQAQVDVEGNKVATPDGETTRPDASFVENGVRNNENRVSDLNSINRELRSFDKMVKADPDAINSLEF